MKAKYLVACQSDRHGNTPRPEISVNHISELETEGWLFATQANFPWVIANAAYKYFCPECAAHYTRKRDDEIATIIGNAKPMIFYEYLKLRHRLIELRASTSVLERLQVLCNND